MKRHRAFRGVLCAGVSVPILSVFLFGGSVHAGSASSTIPMKSGPTPAPMSRSLENETPPADVLRSPAAVQVITTRLGWPLGWSMQHPRLRITNYLDHDPLPGVRRDYAGGDLTYNGHLGTDYNLNSFRDMDEGVPVLAAANGRVFYVHDNEYDRWTNAPNTPWNAVYIVHEDGLYTMYGHLRTNSATVLPGEYVREGQMIGFVGSSGLTLMPHLHFEVAGDNSGTTGLPNDRRDPYSGASNPIPSLWKHQEDYVGDDSFRLLDLGVTTGSAFFEMGGLGDWSAFKERPSQPAIVGADEPSLKIWTLVFGQVGDPYHLVLHRPDGSVFAEADAQVPLRDYGNMWQYWDVPFGWGSEPPAHGDWWVELISHGAVMGTNHFIVGETSRYAPRFHWLAGRSFHLSSQIQQDMPMLSYLGAPMDSLSFALENAPSNVSLSQDEYGQPTVTIGPAGPDLSRVRSREFTLLATDPDGRQDRMHYHLVNGAASTLGSPPVVSAPGSASCYEGEVLTTEVSATDPDGDALTLTAGLAGLPVGNAASFVLDPGGTSGTLVWPTHLGEAGTYAVTFTARTSFGAVPSWGYPAIVQTRTVTTLITVRRSLAARAFTYGENRTLRLFTGEPLWCANVEPINSSFQVSDIDPTSVELVSQGTGSVDRISALATKRFVAGDRDRNTIEDVSLCFAGDNLRRLFDGIEGRRGVNASIEGATVSGAKFHAPVTMDVVVGAQDMAAVSPNPLNPGASLRVYVPEAGPLRVTVYDTHGRLVRTLMETAYTAAGPLTIRVDGRDMAGKGLGSGVYFFRLETAGKSRTGRFVVLK